MSDQNATLVEVFDSDLNELLSMRLGGFVDRKVEVYASIQIAYLSGNDEVLRELLEAIKVDPALELKDRTFLGLIGNARLELRVQAISRETSQELEKFIAVYPEWEGELCFVLANRSTAEKNYTAARDYSNRAWKALRKTGAKKKAIRALMNYVAADSCLSPEKHYLSDLYFVYREAKKVKDRTSIGTTLLNLSREYQKLGAFSVALKYSNRSLAILSKNAGNLAYFFALAHRCHLYCQMGAFAEASLDAEAARCSRFPEIHAAIEILEKEYSDLKALEISSSAGKRVAVPTFTWSERTNEASAPKLSKLEQKVLELLSENAKSTDELTILLYGSRLDSSITQNRLYNLLNRKRSIWPTPWLTAA